MKSTFIWMVFITGVALVTAQTPCDEIVEYDCNGKGDPFYRSYESLMSNKCKAKAQGFKAENDKKCAEICAGKADQNKTCKALEELFEECAEKLGDECKMGKGLLSCKYIIGKACNVTAQDKKMEKGYRSSLTPECVKKYEELEAKRVAACASTNDEDKRCESIRKLKMIVYAFFKECHPKA